MQFHETGGRMERGRVPSDSDRHRTIGWAFVVTQFVLVAVVALLPRARHWPTPRWVRLTGLAVTGCGLATATVSARSLGPALTPTPVPRPDSELRTDGPYRHARHPIYGGVLIALLGWTLRSGNLATAGAALTTAALFRTKAGFEEARLRERFPDYDERFADVPRFFPRLRPAREAA
jgi:protein-S-isoprenylcysteine O-methyltransferase Ste14